MRLGTKEIEKYPGWIGFLFKSCKYKLQPILPVWVNGIPYTGNLGCLTAERKKRLSKCSKEDADPNKGSLMPEEGIRGSWMVVTLSGSFNSSQNDSETKDKRSGGCPARIKPILL